MAGGAGVAGGTRGGKGEEAGVDEGADGIAGKAVRKKDVDEEVEIEAK